MRKRSAEAEAPPSVEPEGKGARSCEEITPSDGPHADVPPKAYVDCRGLAVRDHAAGPPCCWAHAKGHVPRRGPVSYAGDVVLKHHVDVVRVHARWPANKLVTEAEYDDAAAAAYGIEIRESWGEKPEKE